jgi:hypothetical protein
MRFAGQTEEPFEAHCERFTIYDGEYFGSGYVAQREISSAATLHIPSNFPEYSPLTTNPFAAKKFRGAEAQKNIVFGPQIVRFDRIARCEHNCMYVNPVEG